MSETFNRCCCDSGKIRIVAGNDLTVEAGISVWDAVECVYVPIDLTGASDVALNMVGTFTRIPGDEAAVKYSRVSAFFPAGRLGRGVYGVEVTFRDADGRCRAFERSLIEVVESSGEATVESTAEGETGDGLNITVDVRTRTVRIGGSGAADYPSLPGKPSINGVVLEGNRTAEELGMYSRKEADAEFETKSHAAETFQTKESAAEADKRVQGILDTKVDKIPGKGLSANDLTDERAGKVDMLETGGRANEYLNGAGTYSRPVGQGYGVSVAEDNTVSVDAQVIASQSDVASVASDLRTLAGKEQDDIDKANASISALNALTAGHTKSIEDLSTTKADKADVEGYYQKEEALLDHRVVAEALVSLAARLDALEGSRGLLGDATAGTLDVSEITKCSYPMILFGHGVPAEANKPTNLPEGLPWDGLPMFKGQQYINLDAPSGGLYYAVGVDSVNYWKQA